MRLTRTKSPACRNLIAHRVGGCLLLRVRQQYLVKWLWGNFRDEWKRASRQALLHHCHRLAAPGSTLSDLPIASDKKNSLPVLRPLWYTDHPGAILIRESDAPSNSSFQQAVETSLARLQADLAARTALLIHPRGTPVA